MVPFAAERYEHVAAAMQQLWVTNRPCAAALRSQREASPGTRLPEQEEQAPFLRQYERHRIRSAPETVMLVFFQDRLLRPASRQRRC